MQSAGNPIALRFGSYGWDILDVTRCDLEITCEGCGKVYLIENYICGKKYMNKCFSCFRPFELIYYGIEINRS